MFQGECLLISPGVLRTVEVSDESNMEKGSYKLYPSKETFQQVSS